MKDKDYALGLIQLPAVNQPLEQREAYAKADNERLIHQIQNEEKVTGHRADFIRYSAKRVLKELDALANEYHEFFGSFDVLTDTDMVNILSTSKQRILDKDKEK